MTESFIQLPADGDGKKTRTNELGGVHQQITQVHDGLGNEVQFATADKQLPDNHNVTVSNMVTAPETGLNKEVTQLQLQSLIETLQELTLRLTVLTAVKGINESLRVTPITSVSTAVTGPITSAQHLANELTKRIAIENNTAIQSNIINVTGV
jgi:hypothetical protein